MIAKIQGRPLKILEPSAGKGDIIERLTGQRDYNYHCSKFPSENVFAIEIDPTLQATLRGKHIKVIDSDFLAYTGPDKWDVIISNPPFDEGAKHLMKAIDIMYRGQIIFLLNAETIRNPHTKERKALLKRLNELGAKIEYHKSAFEEAERKTKVEVALVYIKIDRQVEDDLFAGAKDTAAKSREKVKGTHAVSTGKTIEELVLEYNEIIRIGTDTIVAYYRNYNKVGGYLSLNDTNDRNKHSHRSDDDLTAMLQASVNDLLVHVRTDFWRSTLKLDAVNKRMTSQKQKEFEHQLAERCHMDFTEHNIRTFILNIIGSYEQTLIEATLDLFDKFTRHGYRDTLYEDNILHFNGWKTNSAFKVGKKVIMPLWGGFWDASWKRWKVDYNVKQQLMDWDKVMNFFSGGENYLSICQALEMAFGRDGRDGDVQTRDIHSTYFKITVYKKNTIHITFKDQDILRRFNVVACRGKGWLPDDYCQKKYTDLSPEEKQVAESFDGKKTYEANVNTSLFRIANPQLQIGA
jgi:hypothetical protein